MRHLGDISKVCGGDIAPVDVITFGSPCQDLSIAGGQKGMKYVCPVCGIEFAITADAAACPMCGAEIEKTRSGLFIEAVRIIKEMREKTNGKQPRFAVWENVPGAFSSNKGADFQTVLLELCRITEPKAPAVAIPKTGWPGSGQLNDVGGGSIAWRTLDAQFHGVPQRRRRIILVCDFAGQCAGQLLFKPSGLPGYPAEGVREGETLAGTAAFGTDRPIGIDGYNACTTGDVSATLGVNCGMSTGRNGVLCRTPLGFAYKASPSAGGVGAAIDLAPTLLSERNDAAVCLNYNARKTLSVNMDKTGTLTARENGNLPIVLQGSMIGRADQNGPQGDGINEGVSFTLNTTDRHAVVVENHPQDSRVTIREDGTVQTLTGQMGTGGGNVPLVMQEV